jgi:hypothetical protein
MSTTDQTRTIVKETVAQIAAETQSIILQLTIIVVIVVLAFASIMILLGPNLDPTNSSKTGMIFVACMTGVFVIAIAFLKYDIILRFPTFRNASVFQLL